MNIGKRSNEKGNKKGRREKGRTKKKRIEEENGNKIFVDKEGKRG